MLRDGSSIQREKRSLKISERSGFVLLVCGWRGRKEGRESLNRDVGLVHWLDTLGSLQEVLGFEGMVHQKKKMDIYGICENSVGELFLFLRHGTMKKEECSREKNNTHLMPRLS